MLTNVNSGNRLAKNNKIVSVGILSEDKYTQQYDLTSKVTTELGVQSPSIFSFRKFDKKQEVSPTCFTAKDLNWKGEIVNEELKKFVDQPFDLLICYYSKSNLHLDYLSLLSKATFKIGFAELEAQFLDLEVVVKSDQVNDFFSETKKYLKILQKL